MAVRMPALRESKFPKFLGEHAPRPPYVGLGQLCHPTLRQAAYGPETELLVHVAYL